MAGSSRWIGTGAAVLFAVLWSTGFIFTKMAVAHASPMAFLLVRFTIAGVLVIGLGLLSGAAWPPRAQLPKIILAGLLLQAGYLAGVSEAIHHGLSASIASIVVALQPLLTGALAGPLLGERVRPVQWGGLILGLFGIVMVLSDKASIGSATPLSMGLAGFALCAITVGSIFQKRFGASGDLRMITAVHFLVSGVAVGVIGVMVEPMRIDWTPDFTLALLWLVLVLSIASILLYYWLLRHGQASHVASFMYLVPPLTVLFAWYLFDERIAPMGFAGMAVVAVGVAMATRQSAKPPAARAASIRRDL